MNEQVVTWTQWRWAVALMTAVLGVAECMVYYSLSAAERGEPGTAIWSPIAIVYELFGYHAALAVIPVVWVVLLAIATWQTLLRSPRSE